MRLLLDACVWGGAGVSLRASGHDVIWAGDWSEDPGDEQILAHAFSEGRILVTLDKDFAELAIVHAVPHCGILRIVNFSAGRQAGCLQLNPCIARRGAVVGSDHHGGPRSCQNTATRAGGL